MKRKKEILIPNDLARVQGEEVRGGGMERIVVSLKVLVAQLCLTLAIPWTVVCQVLLSMGFPRQEYWSGLPVAIPSPGNLPDPGFEPSLHWSGLFTIWATREALVILLKRWKPWV